MAELRYTKDHEWVRMDGDTATVGISDHAQNALGDVVFVDLPEIGREVSAGEAVAEYLRPVRERYQELIGDRAELERILAEGAGKAHERAAAKLAVMKERVGLLPGAAVTSAR